MSLAWTDRRAFLRLLSDHIERENRAVKQASRGVA